jgi:phospholipid/cholesterol/gamma-HCH transport system substrate-binding protein
MGEWTKAAKVGLFVLVAAAATVFIYRFVSRSTGIGGGYTVFAEFKEATGLAPQSRVMMAGIPVGTIESIRLDRGMARIDIRMAPEVPLHEDATVGRRSSGILGEYFLSLAPGTEGRPNLKDGDEIKVVIEASSTDQIMADIARIADRVKLVSENLANTIGSPEGQAEDEEHAQELGGRHRGAQRNGARTARRSAIPCSTSRTSPTEAARSCNKSSTT